MKFIYSFLAFISRALNHAERKVRLKIAIKHGMTVGRGTRFVGDVLFGTEPYLISIGKQCLITDGVKFISHDGGVGTLFIKEGKTLKEVYAKAVLAGKIKIGDNVFIGSNSILLYGTCISNNTLIAAGSVVKGKYPPNTVVAGVPAKVISSLTEYEKKNKKHIALIEKKDDRRRRRAITDHVNLTEKLPNS